MVDELRWSFEITREQLSALQLQLEWALQHQNERFVTAVRGERSWAIRRILVNVLVGLGGGLLVLLCVLAPARARHDLGFVIGMLALFATCAVVINVKSWHVGRRRRSARWAGNSLARSAARTYHKPMTQAPYTIEYSCDGERTLARVDRLGIARTTVLASARVALCTPDAVFLFRRRWSFRPFRYIYASEASDAATRDALLAVLARLGVATVPITGPVAGYVAPIPSVRALD